MQRLLEQEGGPAKLATMAGNAQLEPDTRERIGSFVLADAEAQQAGNLGRSIESACRLIVAGDPPQIPSQARAISFVTSKISELAKINPDQGHDAATIVQLHAAGVAERQVGSRQLVSEVKRLDKAGNIDGAFALANDILMASRTPPTSAERMTLQFMEDSYVKLTKAGGPSAGLAAILMIGFGEKNSRARRIGEGSLNHQLDMSTRSGSYDQAGMTARVVLVSGTDPQGPLHRKARSVLRDVYPRLDDFGRKATDATLASNDTWADPAGTMRQQARDRIAARYTPEMIFKPAPEEAAMLLKKTLNYLTLRAYDPSQTKPNLGTVSARPCSASGRLRERRPVRVVRLPACRATRRGRLPPH